MLLHLLLASPLAAAGLMAFASRTDGRSAARLAGALSFFILLATLPLLGGAFATEAIAWLPIPGTKAVAQYALASEGVAGWMVVLSALLTFAVLLVSVQTAGERFREYAIWIFVLESALFGSFLAADAVLFFLFFEAMVAPAAFLIATFGGSQRRRASILFAIYTLAGSAPLAVALWCTVAWTGSTDPAAISTAVLTLPASTVTWLFLGFAVAFAVKTPLVPFHGWQSLSYSEAPAPLGALLSGAMAKVGLYGLLRWTLPLFPAPAHDLAMWLIGLGLLTTVYGAVVAWRQDEIRKVLAFSSLSHLGLAVAGLFSFDVGATAGVIALMVAHGLSAGALFLLSTLPERWMGSRALTSFGGLASASPVFSFLFLAASMASVAVPGSLGFVGEFLILQGLWTNGAYLAIIGGLGAILSAAYSLRLIQALLFGKTLTERRQPANHHDSHGHATPAFRNGPEIGLSEGIAIGVLVLLLFAFGMRPGAVLKSVQPSAPPAKAIASIEETR